MMNSETKHPLTNSFVKHQVIRPMDPSMLHKLAHLTAAQVFNFCAQQTFFVIEAFFHRKETDRVVFP